MLGTRQQDAKRRPVWHLCTSRLPFTQLRSSLEPDHIKPWGLPAMNRFLAIACSVLLAMSVAGCVGKGKAPIGKGKAPVPPVVTKG